MDIISEELKALLSRLGTNPDSVDKKTAHYMEHILRLLPAEQETMVKEFFGLPGTDRLSTQKIADRHGLTTDEADGIITSGIRKLAVTPEWQMIKQTI
ncbi:MAG: hypothetical protein ACI3YB_02890 [Prevotella sp.]